MSPTPAFTCAALPLTTRASLQRSSLCSSHRAQFAGVSLFGGQSGVDDGLRVTNGEGVWIVPEAMRHCKRVPKLGKPADQRKALMRALTTELIRHGRIKTTLVRAKAMRHWADKMIGLAKRGDLHARRQAMGFIYDKQLVHALFEQVPERYGERNGGYTRVLRTMPRRGDNAKMGIIELV